PALSPGRKRRPRCRTMMVPPVTRLPSCALTPSRCELESRPFRELPCPFLCAIDVYLGDDVGNPHPRIHGAVTLGVARTLAALFLEDTNLGPASYALNDGDDARVGDEGGAGENFAAVLLDEQYVVDRELIARRAGRAVNRHELPGRHLALVAAVLDDGVHNLTSLAP